MSGNATVSTLSRIALRASSSSSMLSCFLFAFGVVVLAGLAAGLGAALAGDFEGRGSFLTSGIGLALLGVGFLSILGAGFGSTKSSSEESSFFRFTGVVGLSFSFFAASPIDAAFLVALLVPLADEVGLEDSISSIKSSSNSKSPSSTMKSSSSFGGFFGAETFRAGAAVRLILFES